MKRNKIRLKTTKKQLILLIIELVDLMLGPLLVILYPNNTFFVILTFILVFLIAICMCVLVTREDRIRYKKINEEMKKEEKEMSLHFNNVIFFRDFLYSGSNKDDKKLYIIYSLLISSHTNNLEMFYYLTKDFNNDEIKDFLSSFDFKDSFTNFINEYILNKKENEDFYCFESEINNAYLFLIKLIDDFSLFYDEKYKYIYNNCVRYYYVKNKKTKKYDIYISSFESYKYKFSDMLFEKGIVSKDEAIKRIDELISEYNEKKDNDIYKRINSSVNASYTLYRYEKLDIDSELFLFMDYYSCVIENGHDYFFMNRDINRYLDMFKKYLPNDIYSNIIYYIEEDDMESKMEYNTKLDNLFYEHSSDIDDIIVKLYKGLDFGYDR